MAVGREGSLKLCLGIADLRYAFHLPQFLTEWMNRKAERGKFGEGERYALARNHVDSINIATVTGKEFFSALLKAISDCQMSSSSSSTLEVPICLDSVTIIPHSASRGGNCANPATNSYNCIYHGKPPELCVHLENIVGLVNVRVRLLVRLWLVEEIAEFLVSIARSKFQEFCLWHHLPHMAVMISVRLTESFTTVEVAVCPEAHNVFEGLPERSHKFL